MTGPITFHGQEVVISPYATKKVVTVRTVVRSWSERWLSWPWRPLVHTKQLQTEAHLPTCYHLNGKLIMHPDYLRDLQKAVTRG